MPKGKTKKRKTKESFFTPYERDALRSGAKALRQKADDISEAGPFGTKGPIMRCLNAADILESMAKE
jgi:hypothetical protein